MLGLWLYHVTLVVSNVLFVVLFCVLVDVGFVVIPCDFSG
jgi:hypothetical protein